MTPDTEGRREVARPELIGLVMRLVESERDGDHYLSHLVLLRKVLREPASFAIRTARAFSHVPLTRAECEQKVRDWIDEGWLLPPEATDAA